MMITATLITSAFSGLLLQSGPLVWPVVSGVIVLGLAVSGWLAWHVVRIRRRQQETELTYRRREAEYLKEIDDIKSRFFTNLTHEFRTPLTLILTPTEQLLGEVTDERQRKRLATVHRNARHLLKLINQLLDLSKIESGTFKPQLTEGDLSNFVQQTVQSFDPAAEQRGLLLTYEGHVASHYAFDSESTEKILYNLIGNALKFTEPGGQVSIVLSELPGGIQLTVSDTGIGIPTAKLPNIFDRFYQADGSLTRPYPGTGIGLSLVSELVNLLNGRIAVRSEVGRGTTFELMLPFMPVSGRIPNGPLAVTQ